MGYVGGNGWENSVAGVDSTTAGGVGDAGVAMGRGGITELGKL